MPPKKRCIYHGRAAEKKAMPAVLILKSAMPWYYSTKSAQTTYSFFLCKGKLPYISLLQSQLGFLTGLILRFGVESDTIALYIA